MEAEVRTRRLLTTELLLPLALFVAVTLFILYPVSLHPATLVRGRPFEDAFESIWFLHWYKEALLDLRMPPWLQPDIFYPLGWDLRFAILPPLHPILLAPLTAALGAVLAYNVTIMGACVFAAYGAFRLARALRVSPWAAALVGVAYAFYPQRQVSLDGHLNFLLASLWVPWMLWAVVQARRRPQRRGWWLALGALAFSLSVTAAWPFALMTTTALLVFGGLYLGPSLFRQPREWIRPLLGAMLVILIVAGPWIVQGYAVRQGIGRAAEFPFEGINRSSVSVERFVLPNRLNPPLWQAFQARFPAVATAATSIVNFGYVVLLLDLVGLARSDVRRRSNAALLALTGLCLLLMLGPTLHLLGEPLTVHWPALAASLDGVAPELIAENGQVRLPMPAYVPYKLFSPFRSFHGFDRWGMIASLGVALLAGKGLTALGQRAGSVRGNRPLAVLALLLLLAEFSPLPHTATSTSEMQRNVDEWLAAQPQQNVIIEYPLDYTMKGQSLYYTMAHKQKIVHGYSSILPAGYSEILPVLRQWPSPQTLDLLQQFGTRYILLNIYDGDQRFESETLPQLQARERLELIRAFDDDVGPVQKIYLFELLDADAS